MAIRAPDGANKPSRGDDNSITLPKIAPGAQESQVEYMVIMVLLDLRNAIKQCELFVRIWHA